MLNCTRLAQINIRRCNPLRYYSAGLRPTRSTLGQNDFTLTKVLNQQLSEHNSLPLQVAITESATKKLNSLSKGESNPKLALRVSVESGGCHGFQYFLKLTNEKEYNPDEGDSMFERNGAKVIMDKMSLEILRDSKIDYVKELIGEQFKVVESPLAKSSCGCGSSFDVDFDELEKGPSKEQ